MNGLALGGHRDGAADRRSIGSTDAAREARFSIFNTFAPNIIAVRRLSNLN
jgi:hypothetical protein